MTQPPNDSRGAIADGKEQSTCSEPHSFHVPSIFCRLAGYNRPGWEAVARAGGGELHMVGRKGAWRRVLAAAGCLALGATGFGFAFIDSDIKILKAGGSPTITVQYSGANASRVEIHVNGISAGYRNVDSAKSAGEIVFRIALDRLLHGENRIEVMLFGPDGKLLGSETTTMIAQKGLNPAVYVELPQQGKTVMGTVEIKVGFGISMQEAFVSFFIDKEFRSMRNFPPYTFWWDTTKEKNGWHEIEAWTYDRTQTTRKSDPVRVFVNNPGGRTDRPPAKVQPGVTNPTVTDPAVNPKVGGGKGLKGPGGATLAGTTTTTSTPRRAGIVGSPKINPPMGSPVKQKLTDEHVAKLAGIRVSNPVPIKRAAPKVESTGLLKIGFGTRIGAEGPYDIYLNDELVRFDVEPKVMNGVPLTPFRHLYEHAGGEVDWIHVEKVCTATGLGLDVWIKIGDLFARVNGDPVQLELAAYIENGRTIVPLSFIEETLAVIIEYDAKSGHVLITKSDKQKKNAD